MFKTTCDPCQFSIIYCGAKHCLAKIQNGDSDDVYIWGDHSAFLDQKDKILPHPLQLQFADPIKVQKIACGFDHTLCLTSDKKVYAWGSNN